jgi:hypothetical protein
MRDSSGAELFRGTSGLQVIPFFYTFITALRKSLYAKHLLPTAGLGPATL